MGRRLPPPCKHWCKWVLQSDYRYKSREIARLNRLPRYQPTVTNILGKPLEIVDGLSFVLMYKEIFGQQIYRFRTNKRNPYIIDGGANIGLSVLYFKELYPRSQIVAFEPDDDVFSVLLRNIQTSGYEDVNLLCQALWSSETKLGFMSEGSYGGRISQAEDPLDKVVQTIRLRDYLNRHVDFLKLDIEGAETEVLIDCADSLDCVENLFIEYHSFSKKPQTLHTMINILADAGFRVYITRPYDTSPQPFMQRYVYEGMDLQLNIFAFRS